MVMVENLTFIYSLLSTLSTLCQVSSDLRECLIQTLTVNPADVDVRDGQPVDGTANCRID